MKDNELSKLSRIELLEILIAQSKEVERLTAELEQAQQQLNSKNILIDEAGSIAKASLELNKVFDAAQKAADQYLENIYRLNQPTNVESTYDQSSQMLERTKRECKQLEDETIKYCKEMVRKAKREIQDEWLAFNKYKDQFKNK